MAGIRPLVEADVSRVSDLVWKVLHEQQGSAPPSLNAYIDQLFLRNPWVEESIGSLVYEDSEGKSLAFLESCHGPCRSMGRMFSWRLEATLWLKPGAALLSQRCNWSTLL